MSDTFDEPSEETEAYEDLDEALDDDDLHGVGPEGGRDLDSDVVVDHAELEELGAELDDPDRIGMLDGGMNDPDGVGPPPGRGDDEAGWDVDPVVADRAARTGTDVGADGDAVGSDDPEDLPDVEGDPELAEIDTDPADLEQVADDAPGPDAARW